jgi:hypothetical protein
LNALKNPAEIGYDSHHLSKTEISTHYFISSWEASADNFLSAIREHWQNENGLHWVLDIAFREDASRIRMPHKTWPFCAILLSTCGRLNTLAHWTLLPNTKWQAGITIIYSKSFVLRPLRFDMRLPYL